MTNPLAVELFGLQFPNPVGVAAGYDRNADSFHGFLMAGAGFVETGTVTPRPQKSNPIPCDFLLRDDGAIINRIGFMNDGLVKVRQRLLHRDKGYGIVGVSIGCNRDSYDFVNDYVLMASQLGNLPDYIVANVSTPNTAGVRDLQQSQQLADLIEAVRPHCNVPLLIKISPDLLPPEIDDIADIAMGMKVDGLIISNTTISRPDTLRSFNKSELGGLSGKPLMSLSTWVLNRVYRATRGTIPLIGVGGVSSAEDAIAKIRAGASLVQLYTALVYHGIDLVKKINLGIERCLDREGLNSVSQLRGLT